MGSSVDDFLKEEGIFEEGAVAGGQGGPSHGNLPKPMKEKKISKDRMAQLLKTSRTQV